MAQLSDAFENEILNYFVKFTGPVFARTGLFLALSTAAGTDAAIGASMNEVTGTGYARKPITWGTVAAGSVANSADIVFTATAADWSGAIVAAYVVDSGPAGGTAGNVLFHAPVTSVSLGLNDSLTFVATTGLVLTMQ